MKKTVFQSTVQLLVKVNLFDVVRCQTKFFGRRILASQLLFGYSSVFPCLWNGVLKSHKGIRKNPPVRSNKIKQRQCTHQNIASGLLYTVANHIACWKCFGKRASTHDFTVLSSSSSVFFWFKTKVIQGEVLWLTLCLNIKTRVSQKTSPWNISKSSQQTLKILLQSNPFMLKEIPYL